MLVMGFSLLDVVVFLDDKVDGGDDVVDVGVVVGSPTSVVLDSAASGVSQEAALLIIFPVRSCLLSMVA